MTKQYSNRNVAVGTTKKSQAAVPSMWLARSVLQVCEGGFRGRRGMYVATVDAATSWRFTTASSFVDASG